MNDILKRLGLILGAPLILGILVYLMFQTRAEQVTEDKMSEQQIIEKETEFLYKNFTTVKEIRKIILNNRDKINQSNCVSVLEDLDNDGLLDAEAIINNNIPYKNNKEHNLVVYYNACNINFTEYENITFVISTDKLVNMLYNKDSKDYFKGITIESSNVADFDKENLIPLDIYLK